MGMFFALLMFFRLKLIRLDLEKQKCWQALLGLSGLAFLQWCSNTSLTQHNRQVSETPKSKTDGFRTLMFLLKGVSANESFCTKRMVQSFFRCKNAAQKQLASISQLQGVFHNSTFFYFQMNIEFLENRMTVSDKNKKSKKNSPGFFSSIPLLNPSLACRDFKMEITWLTLKSC